MSRRPCLQRKGMDKAPLSQWLERLGTLHPSAIDLGLERIAGVARSLGLLPVNRPVVTVAGTNGKGSTVAVLEAILAEAGLLSGVFTSPHLRRFNERIRVGGEDASDDEIVAAFAAVDRARGDTSLTYFEFSALAALLVFRARGVEVLVLEVGLGGRLDAVNIVDPSVAVITSIELDHQDWLGDSRDLIAREKAGILRRDRPAVIGDPRPPAALLSCAADVGASPLFCLGREFKVESADGHWRGELRDPAGATHVLPEQPRGALLPANICTALQAALLLGLELSDTQVLRAVAAARPGGRCEQRLVAGRHYVLDVAHNPAAVNNLVEYLGVTPCKGDTITIFSAMADKDIRGMIQAAAGCFSTWFVADQPDNPRAARATDVAALVRAEGRGEVDVSADLSQALRRAQQRMAAGDRLVVFGSFHTVGEVTGLLDSGHGLAAAAGEGVGR